ncbi:MAG: RNA-binding protein, partial [Cytophaga sp.]|nr:RNA-binding protein [Cytophaga sp.]
MFLLTTNVKVIHEIEYKQVRKATHPYAGDKLFRNDNGHFTEITESAGILSNALGFGLGVAVSDFNKDGWPDIHVSNDYMEPDYLYINNKNGTFTNKLSESLQHISQFSMGSDVADINNDAWPDLFTTDMLPEDNKRQKLLYGPENYEQYALQVMNGFHFQNMRNMLHLNNANGTFSEIGQLAGISNTDWSWAPLFADYDNDGWKDLFVTNGYFRDYTNRDFLKFKGDYYFNKVVANEKIDTLELSSSMKSTPLHNYLFRSNGDLTFTDQSNDWGMGKKGFSNGAVYSDLDNDGDLDLVVSNQNEVASLYKNSLREQHANTNFIALQLVGTRLNTRGWGSKIEVYSNGKMQYLEQMPVRGYQSTVSDRIHIGVGTATEIDSIKITWPYGTCTYLYRIKANQMIEVEESLSERKPPLKLTPATPLFTPAPTLGYQHHEYGANDFKRQPLLLTMLSPCGPIMATADVNGDGLEDVYMGGAQGSSGKLYLQTPDGGFRVSPDL